MSMPGGPGGFAPPPPSGMGGGGFAASTEQDATIALATGIFGLLCCGPAGIAAIIYGNKVRNDPTNPKQNFGNIGFILGIIALVLWAAALLYRVVA